MSGRVYRRCGCRTDGKLVGARCPLLKSDGKHGTWTFAVDLKSLDGHRKTLRRGGFSTERKAKEELKKVTDRARTSVKNDDRETVAQYLPKWKLAMRHKLKPKTLHQYGLYLDNDLIPALGTIKLEAMSHEHITTMVLNLEDAGRSATTIKRIVAVLSSALNHAVRTKRLTHNAAMYVSTPAVTSAERVPWTAREAVTFLKTLRHSQVGITANLYGHLTQEAAHAAADSLGGALDVAAAKMLADRTAQDATTLRPHRPD